MRGWDRRLWGIVSDRGLLGTGWHPDRPLGAMYPGEPTRPLLFGSRRFAREFVARLHARYAAYPDGHTCRAWRFRAVRVREVIRAA